MTLNAAICCPLVEPPGMGTAVSHRLAKRWRGRGPQAPRAAWSMKVQNLLCRVGGLGGRGVVKFLLWGNIHNIKCTTSAGLSVRPVGLGTFTMLSDRHRYFQNFCFISIRNSVSTELSPLPRPRGLSSPFDGCDSPIPGASCKCSRTVLAAKNKDKTIFAALRLARVP